MPTNAKPARMMLDGSGISVAEKEWNVIEAASSGGSNASNSQPLNSTRSQENAVSRERPVVNEGSFVVSAGVIEYTRESSK